MFITRVVDMEVYFVRELLAGDILTDKFDLLCTYFFALYFLAGFDGADPADAKISYQHCFNVEFRHRNTVAMLIQCGNTTLLQRLIATLLYQRQNNHERRR